MIISPWDQSIPKPLYDALTESNESYADEVRDFLKDRKAELKISVTSLNKSPRQVLLAQRHYNDIFVDPKQNWHSFMGNIVHWVLEKHARGNPNLWTEIRESIYFNIDGVKVLFHGKFDIYDTITKSIQDWKLTSAAGMVFPKDDHHRQLNDLRYILQSKNIEVNKLQNIYLFPHLDKTKFNDPNYPQENWKIVDVPVFDRKEVELNIKRRIQRLVDNINRSDTKLDYCTDEERWLRGGQFAIYYRKKEKPKKGADPSSIPFSSRAAHRAPTKEEVMQLASNDGVSETDTYVREFKGEPKLCSFCQAAPFCNQYQKEKLAIQKENESLYPAP